MSECRILAAIKVQSSIALAFCCALSDSTHLAVLVKGLSCDIAELHIPADYSARESYSPKVVYKVLEVIDIHFGCYINSIDIQVISLVLPGQDSFFFYLH